VTTRRRAQIGAVCAVASIVVCAVFFPDVARRTLSKWRSPCKAMLLESEVSRALGQPITSRVVTSRYACTATFDNSTTHLEIVSLAVDAASPMEPQYQRKRFEDQGAKVDPLSFGEAGMLAVGGDTEVDRLGAQAWTMACNGSVSVRIKVLSPLRASPSSAEGTAERERTQFEAIELARVAGERLGPACGVAE
jgi:hypothetical protein